MSGGEASGVGLARHTRLTVPGAAKRNGATRRKPKPKPRTAARWRRQTRAWSTWGTPTPPRSKGIHALRVLPPE